MRHIHPFPARMAPDIALNGLEHLPPDYVILDPMVGSGMVPGTAAKKGFQAFGYDLDPLACMISRVNSTKVNEFEIQDACKELIAKCQEIRPSQISLPWIDGDKKTEDYIAFWFAPKQIDQLRRFSYFLVEKPIDSPQQTIDVLKVALSRLIITKEPKASLARDTAHSRPHRTILTNNFDIIDSIPSSLRHVINALKPKNIERNATIRLGNACKMQDISSCSIDAIITSPPYLNAIDYMRGHKLSLVWMQYNLSKLKDICANSIGGQSTRSDYKDQDLESFLQDLPVNLDKKIENLLRRYYQDLCSITKEAFRVLKFQRKAIYVMGDSQIKGCKIENSHLLTMAAQKSGFEKIKHAMREIPENRRYMPVINSKNTNLSKRMRQEHVITFTKD